MFTVILINKAVYVIANNGSLVSASSYLKRDKALVSYFNTTTYLDNNKLLANDSSILS